MKIAKANLMKVAALFLVALMTLNVMTAQAAMHLVPSYTNYLVYDLDEPEIGGVSENQQWAYQLYREMGRPEGLLDFEFLDVCFYSDEPIAIIVEFNSRPARVEQALAQATGGFVPFNAEVLDDISAMDRQIFMDGLDEIFGSVVPFGSEPPFRIMHHFDVLLNAVSMVAPANKIHDILAIPSVFAISADLPLYTSEWGSAPSPAAPLGEAQLHFLREAAEPVFFYEDESAFPSGTLSAEWLGFSGIEHIHALGNRGEGVLIGVIDSGVDYNHPDLIDVFMSWDSLYDVPPAFRDYVLYRNGMYRYLGWDFWAPFATQAWRVHFPERHRNDPMETLPSDWAAVHAADPSVAELSGTNTFYSTHGTHVAGIIVGQGINYPNNVLGVAPDARIVVYRTGSIYGSSPGAASIAGMERAAIDGVDILTWSAGTTGANAMVYHNSVTAVYLVLTYDVIVINSAGNSGPNNATITAPGGAPVIFTVGSTGFADRMVNLRVGDTTFDTRLRFDDGVSRFEYDGGGIFSHTFPALIQNPDGSYNFFVLPWRDTVGMAGRPSASDGLPADDPLLAHLLPGARAVGIATGAEAHYQYDPSILPYLAGSIVVIYRGHTFVDQARQACLHGAGGILFIDNVATGLNSQTAFGGASYLPYLSIGRDEGFNLLNALYQNDWQGTFTGVYTGNRLANSSSRGPIAETFNIKPDIFTPGVGIMSTVPPWRFWPAQRPPGEVICYYTQGYDTSSGTSMAAPHLAGLVALLINHDVTENGRDYDRAPREIDGLHPRRIISLEVRGRLNNTANTERMDSTVFYGVHDTGSGHANIDRAIAATSFVSVMYDYVPLRTFGFPGAANWTWEFVSAPITNFSFGYTRAADALSRYMVATVHNAAPEAKTFNVEVLWNLPHPTHGVGFGNNIRDPHAVGVTLDVPSAVTVNGGGIRNQATTEFTATMNVPGTLTDAHVGSYQGFVILTNAADSNDVLRLPFAIEVLPAISYSRNDNFVRILNMDRNVVSSNPDTRQNSFVTNAEIRRNVEHVFVYPHATAPADNRVMEVRFPFYNVNEPGVRVGYARTPFAANAWVPNATATAVTITTNALNATHAISNAAAGHYIVNATLVDRHGETLQVVPWNFIVDNEPPEVDILDKDIETLTITGTIFDAGMKYMFDNNIRYERVNRLPSHNELAIIAIVDENYYTRGVISPDPSGEMVFPFVIDLSTLFPLDAAPIPANAVEGPEITHDTVITIIALDHFTERASSVVEANRSAGFSVNGFSFASGANIGWLGVNMYTREVTFPEPSLPTPSFSIFNNGSLGCPSTPNESLADAGLIRMWTLLDSVEAPVYFAAASTITAFDQDNNCAMAFVRVNRGWDADAGWLGYFSNIDVDTNASWEFIDFTITIFGQEVTVVLHNEKPATAYHDVIFIVERGGIANGVNVYAEQTSFTVQVPHGGALPAAPTIGTRTGFQFVGWYPTYPADHVGNVYSSLTFRAVFTELWHYVTFAAGEGGSLEPVAPFGLVVRTRDGHSFWPTRVPTPVAEDGFAFAGWYPANPANYVVRESVTFTALFEPIPVAEPRIVSVTPSPAQITRSGMVEITVTTQGMPDGAWIDINVWHTGLSIVGGPRFYVVNNQATFTIAAIADAPLGSDGFSVVARMADQWGASVILDHYAFVITVIAG